MQSLTNIAHHSWQAIRRAARALLLITVSVVVSLLLSELVAGHILARIFMPAAMDKGAYQLRLDSAVRQLHSRELKRLQFLPELQTDQHLQHPFLGFVPRPDLKRPCGPAFHAYMCVTNEPRPINFLGLYEDEFSREPRPNTIRIGVAGGSVANLLIQTSKDVLKEALEADNKFRGTDVEVLNLAIPGFKQPQQTNLVVYLLALGYRFDAIVDLAGLNEVYLSRQHNIDGGVGYAFPYRFYWFPSPPPVAEEDVARRYSDRLLSAEYRLAAIAILAPRKRLADSVLIRWAALALLDNAENQVRRVRQSLDLASSAPAYSPGTLGYLFGKGLNERCADAACTEERVSLWATGARINNALLEQVGARYFEVLQPNHYVIPKEAMNAADAALLNPGFGWHPSDTEAWREMQRLIGDFRQQGLRAADFSHPYIFQQVPSGVLVDDCCHLTAAGYDTLAKKLAAFVAETW